MQLDEENTEKVLQFDSIHRHVSTGSPRQPNDSL
jgi:hypothetical protein